MNRLKYITWITSLLASIPFLIIFLTVGNPEVKEHTWKPQKNIAPLLALGASAGLGILQGISQRRQARELERNNPRPTYTPNSNIIRNQALAEQMSKVGLPSQVYNNQLNQLQQNFATGLRTIGTRGNVATNTNALVANANRAVSNLNAQDAQARLQGTQMLMNANTALANEQRQAFNVNQLQPYQQTRQDVASLRRAGTQNIFGSLGMIGQGAMMGMFNNLGGATSTASSVNQNYTTNPLLLQPQSSGLSGMWA